MNQIETNSLEKQAVDLIKNNWFEIREAAILGQRELLRRAKLGKNETRKKSKHDEAVRVGEKILEFERLHYAFPDGRSF